MSEKTEKTALAFPLKRRDMLKVMTGVPAAFVPLASLGAVAAYAHPATPAEPSPAAFQPKTLDPHEWQTVRILSDWIIPADDRSGSATQAGVPEFIDEWLTFKGGNLLAEVRGGLTWIDMECNRLFQHDFTACSAAQQKQILDRIAYPGKAAPGDVNAAAAFSHLRDLVVSGFFSSKMGVGDLPYLGNKMLAEWDGCPENVLERLGVSYDAHGNVKG
ncbi:MAG TPA: gluconate 2-dehydrogenase subunit 3 family protein [Terriglobia bacterium]|nr:gluconate 2-dehydrogenase subunit 3 family protein [Terriglobia bacterium]